MDAYNERLENCPHMAYLNKEVFDRLSKGRHNTVEASMAGSHLVLIFTSELAPNIRRVVTASRVDEDNVFKVSVSEIATQFEYCATTKTYQFVTTGNPKSMHVNTLDMFGRVVYAAATGKLDDSLIPSKELIDRRDDINKRWLCESQAKVVLFNFENRTNDYRFRIVHDSNTVVADNLSTDLDGNTCRMFATVAKDAFKRGFLEGRISYADGIARDAVVTATFGIEAYYVEAFAPEAKEIIRSGSFRKNKHRI